MSGPTQGIGLDSIAISSLSIGEPEQHKVLEVLRSGHLVQGPVVAELERSFAELVSTRFAVALNSGTTALLAALATTDLAPGDEVITSPFTFAATLNAALEAGATVCFSDISLDDFCMDPATLMDVTTDRTRVVLPVHLYGQTADLAPIVKHSADHDLVIIEDAAQAHGATYRGRPAGSFGIGCFSLYATKNITSAEGGILSTDNAALADRVRVLRNQGMRQRYDYAVAGHNWRMSDLHAAVALPQVHRLAETTRRRQRNASLLSEGLADLDGLRTPQVMADRRHVFHQYTVRVTADGPIDRDQLMARLDQDGIGYGIYYPRLVHDYDCYRNDPRVKVSPTPRAQQAASEVLSLPVHPQLSDTDLERIVTAVRSAYLGSSASIHHSI